MKNTTTLDLEWLASQYDVLVNDIAYHGSIAVGDVLEVNGLAYVVRTINEDCILVKELDV